MTVPGEFKIERDYANAFRTNYLLQQSVCNLYKDRQTEKQAGRQAERDYTGLLKCSANPKGKTQALKNHTWDKNGVVASKFQTHYWCHCRDRRRIHTSGVISYGEVHVHAQLPCSS